MLILDNSPQANTHGLLRSLPEQKGGLRAGKHPKHIPQSGGWLGEEGRMPEPLREGEAAPRKYLAAHPRLWTGCRLGWGRTQT